MPTYFCFIERDPTGTPHMEPLSADTHDEALAEAGALLLKHASGIAAHVLLNDTRIGTVRALRPPGIVSPLANRAASLLPSVCGWPVPQ